MRALSHGLKPLVLLVCLLPALSLGYRALAGTLGVNPVETLLHGFGNWTLRFLILTLLITPLRLIPGWSGLTALRRMMGLSAFFYATLHLMIYLAFDQLFDWTAVWDDIVHRPYITLGMSAYLLMIPLALTSSSAMMQRMGCYWKKLHLFIYLITTLGILHFFLQAKSATREPWIYMGIFALLVVLRVALAGKKATKLKRRARDIRYSE